MSRAEAHCPHCGAPLREERLGVRMTPLKARMFDAIKRGVPTERLREMNPWYRVHVHQIREMLVGTGWTIRCGKGRRHFELLRD